MGALTRETKDGVAVLTLNRPPANAIDLALARELDAMLAALESEERVLPLVLTGAGRCFSAGLDLKALPTYGRGEQRELVALLNSFVLRLYGYPAPFVVAVNGHAMAGGFILAVTGDVRIGADGPHQIALTEVKVGVPFPVGPLELVRAELAPSVARELVLGGGTVTPEGAKERGILDEIVPENALLPRALAVAKERAALPRATYVKIKRGLRAEALGKIERAVRGDEEMLEEWLTDEALAAAASVLRA